MASFLDNYKKPILAAIGTGAVAALLYTQFRQEAKVNEVPLTLPLRETHGNPELKIDSLLSKQSVDMVDVDGQRVLMRVDYNVPIKDGVVMDKSRIASTIETLKYILSKKGPKGGVKCIVLIAHLGRPGINYKKADYSLEPVAKALQQYIPEAPVRFLPDCVGPVVEKHINDCKPGTVFLLENLRFHIEETGKGLAAKGHKVIAKAEDVAAFRKGLSRLGDIFVFEAFGAAHRPHSSITGIDLPIRVAGLGMKRELNYYNKVLGNPPRPFVAILGGARVSDKLSVINNLLELVDELIIGGGMAYTFKQVIEKVKTGSSIFDPEGAEHVENIMLHARQKNVRIHLPVDHVIADKFSPDAKVGVTDDFLGIPDGWMALDIGPKSRQLNSSVMARAKTILWNGPLGVFEMGPFSAGTLSAMWDIVSATNNGALTIIAGGDTGHACEKFYVGSKPVASQVTHVSTGGGSSLVLMEGKQLPAVHALSDCNASNANGASMASDK